MIARSDRALTLGLLLALSASALAVSCGDDSDPPGGAGAAGGAGGAGTTSSGGGEGGVTCDDVQADTENCGACGHRCAPGQTCQDGACVCGSDVVSFAADVQPILTASCAKTTCHTGPNPRAQLDLTAGAAHAELVGPISIACTMDAPLIAAGQPSESYFMKKILGSELCAGKRMPPSASLPEDQIKTISDWICAGALDD